MPTALDHSARGLAAHHARQAMTLPGTGQVVSYGYDAAGQLTELTDWASATAVVYT
jgi:YD repeat-containing protein